MKVSLLWLQEWVSLSLTKEALASTLTMAGLEVEGTFPVSGVFDGVIVAEVKKVMQHPNADRLSLCEVYTGEATIPIVCGAPNVYTGLKVALAQVGAKLPNGLVIKASKLRGELSQGMLCSVTELGIEEDSEGILHLPADAPVGMDIRKYLSLDDAILELNLTPNRGDCLSVLGIAREISALSDQPLQKLPDQQTKVILSEQLDVQVKAKDACPHYCGRVVRNIDPAACTPLWMQERLRRSGIRPVYPIVDITNYVMLELGQPMHAFNLNAMQGQVIVRFAEAGEKLTLLNDEEALLNENILVIAQQQGQPIAVAGVMGGKESAIQSDTTSVFLESAFFNPSNIAGVARQYGLKTEASHRFERGVDPNLAQLALERASTLLVEITGGKLGPITCIKDEAFFPSRKPIIFHPSIVKKITGVQIEEEVMQALLSKLDIIGDFNKINQDGWILTTPSHRFDLSIEVDIVEEIIRLHGYDSLPAELMTASMRLGSRDPIDQLNINASKILRDRGYHETINYSFVDPVLQEVLFPDVESLRLMNPISEELSQMRLSLWPGLIAAMVYNSHRQQVGMRLFETGVLFKGDREIPAIAGLLAGVSNGANWSEASMPFDFFDMKGDLEALFSNLRLKNVNFVAERHSALHPTRSAKLVYDNKVIGWCGALHPRVIEALELSSDVLLFELNLELLTSKSKIVFHPISKYPKIRRDLSLLAANEITVGQIEQVIRSVIANERLKAFDVFDVYRGKSIPEGKKSIGIALTMQDDTLTMTDEQVNALIDAVIRKLNLELAITLREQP